MRIRFILLALVLGLCSVQAQESLVSRSDSLIRVDGEDFLIHRVEARQGLFSIAKAYGMTLSRLVFSNPGIMEGIHPGQYIRIPKQYLDEVGRERASEPLRTDGEFVLYEVPAKQTLYAIAKEHSTTVTALMEANPELQDGLKVGTTIRIPVQRLIPKEDTGRVELRTRPSRQPEDTGQGRTLLPTESLVGRKDRVYEVAVLLPFFLRENDSLIRYDGANPPDLFNRSKIALHFYEGLLIALDSVRATGIDVRLRVYDTGNNEKRVDSLIARGALKGCDLVIGPLYSGEFQKAARGARKQGIPIITPTIQSMQAVDSNAMVLKLMPSEERMLEAVGRHLAHKRGTNNLVLHYGKPAQQKLLWSFRKGLGSDSLARRPSFPAVDISKGLRDSIFHRLSPVQPNILLVLSSDESRVAQLVRSLSNWAKETDITVYGMTDWPRFKNVEADHWDRLRLHVPDPFAIDFTDLATERFILRFRQRFGTEPNTFAYRGYDIGIHLLRALPGLRAEGIDHLLRVNDRGLQNDFQWVRVPDGGLENAAPRIVDHTGLKSTFLRP